MSKTALITGASRGLGLALARALAARGWKLVIDARGAEALENARAELAKQTEVIAISGDISDEAHARALAQAAKQMGGLDMLVNNASILGPQGVRVAHTGDAGNLSPQPNLAEYPLDILEQVYRVNVLAPLRLIQLTLPILKPQASILNITSDAGVEGYAGWGGYGSSKAALEQISRVLAAEHPKLRVYWVDPGDMNTQMQQEAFPGEDISDRPLPEASVPGLLRLIEDDLPSGRYRAREMDSPPSPIGEFRISQTVQDFEQANEFYQQALGLSPVLEWDRPDGRGVILQLGKATLELLDATHAEVVDRLEAGRSIGAGVRFAVEVKDLEAASQTFQRLGAKPVHVPVHTPWGDYNQRLQTPDGTQMTLFELNAKELVQ